MSKIDDLSYEMQTELKAARAIADRAEKADRDFTSEERAKVAGHMANAKSLRSRITKEKADADLAKAVRDTVGGIGLLGDDGDTFGPSSRSGFLNVKALKSDMFRRIDGSRADAYGRAKGLTSSGAVATSVTLDPADPVSLPHPVPSLLGALPTVVRDSPTYRFLKQTTRTMQAAPVAPGDTKPTSTLKVEAVDGRLRVVAHISDPIDKYDLQDSSNLQTWVEGELGAGLQEALESQILTGDGEDENFTGLAHVSGVLHQSFTGDPLTTLAASATQLEAVSAQARLYALAPADWLAITTTRNTSGNFDLGGAIDAATRRAWGVPIVLVPGLAAGTAWAIGDGALQLSTDENGVVAEWDSGGDLFKKNELICRVEGRFNLDVLRPGALVEIVLNDDYESSSS